MVKTNLKCSLFYVDDDQDDLDLFKMAAEDLGEDVCVFEYAELMLHTLHNPPPSPSLVFVDLNMPTMNGFEVIKNIKMSPDLFHLPIIVYSTSANPSDINRCKNLGVSMFVTKPTNFELLKKTIAKLIDIDWTSRVVDENNFVYVV